MRVALAAMCLLLAAGVAWSDALGPWPPAPPTVAGFTAYGGDWSVRDGVLGVGVGPGPKLVLDAPPREAGEAGVALFFASPTGGPAGLVLKTSECAVGADAFNGYEIALDAQKQELLLGRHRQNFEPLHSVPVKVPVGVWVRLAVRFAAASFEVYVDGLSVARYEDAEHPLRVGGIGLRSWQRETRYRDFWVVTDGRRREVPFVARLDAAAVAVDARAVAASSLPPIAFVTRHALSRPNAVGLDIWQAQPRELGCAIRVLDPGTGAVRTIYADDQACIYDLNVSLDARTIFFSRRGADSPYWHLWRIGVDGQGARQLTDGPYYDVSPVQVPGGDLVFVSTRRGGYTVCQPGPASNLYRVGADGGEPRCVSMNTLSDLNPQLLPDGRVLFTRWEYIDRDLTYRQSLWTQNPDGTGYQLYFGNTVREVGSFLQARPLPGRTDTVVCTFAPHHGFPHGAIGLVRTAFGAEAPRGRGYQWITHEFPEIGDTAHEFSYRDPFPLTDSLFVVSYGGGGRYRLYLLDIADRRRLLHEEASQGCYSPVALRPTHAARLAEQWPPAETPHGTLVLADVYRGLTGVERGRAKWLRIMEQVRKSEDLVSRAYDQSPAMSYATYYAKRCWGTVPIEADGSAHFTAPALAEIYFQVLDEQGRELQRMTSAAQLMPGQKLGCVGCHEPRTSSPPLARVPLAARRPPTDPVLPTWAPDGIIDFPRTVQPVLDEHCVSCHDGANPAGGMVLSGDKTRLFSMAYDNLLGRSRSYRQHNMASGEMLADEAAKGLPLVHFFWLLRTPTAVNQPLSAGTLASRLPDYLTAGHVGHDLTADEKLRVYTWIDADVPYYGSYAHSRPRSPGRRDLCTDAATGDESAWFARDYRGVYDRRCAGCHGPIPHPNDHGNIWDGRLAWLNLSRPELSPALTAHLPRAEGGRGQDKHVLSRGEPDYQTMLSALRVGRDQALAVPEADMPGFQSPR